MYETPGSSTHVLLSKDNITYSWPGSRTVIVADLPLWDSPLIPISLNYSIYFKYKQYYICIKIGVTTPPYPSDGATPSFSYSYREASSVKVNLENAFSHYGEARFEFDVH